MTCICDNYDQMTKSEFSLFNTMFKQKVQDTFVEKWKKDVYSFPILRSYVLYKSDFQMETYVTTVKDFKLRRSVAQLRLNSHQLAIEKGRHVKPKIPESARICILCNQGDIEDECHFLVDCSFYIEERVHLLCKILLHNPSFFTNVSTSKEAYILIMSCQDEGLMFNIAKFINKCFQKRHNYVNPKC